MKKLFLTAAFSLISLLAFADNDRVIAFNQLPANVQTFIQTHFNGVQPDYISKDWDSYEVFISNGIKMEFSRRGNWQEIKSHRTALPESITKLLPQQLLSYIKTNYANTVITEMNKERYGYEIKLSNGLELMFNKNGAFLGIEDYDDRWDD